MSIELVTILMFGALILLMITGLPLAFSLGSCSILFILLLWGSDGLGLVNRNLFSIMNNFLLLSAPLFIFMAYMLQNSGVAEGLYDVMYKWSGRLRGGLAMGTVVICTVIAAMSGISAAGTLSMGVIALPAMLKRKYNKEIALGVIAAGGALGSLIPPSIGMIIYCFLTSLSVGRMFLGGILPGLLLSFLYIVYVGIRSCLNPALCPALDASERSTWSDKFRSLKDVILPILLIIAVLGSIFDGIATPTESAAIGAFGTIICALINRKFTWKGLKITCYDTLRNTTMVVWIMVGATAFSAVYTGLGATQLINSLISEMNVNPWFIIIGMQITYFILGMVMDPMGILMITIPIYAPLVISLGFDPIWFGILIAMNFECAYLTPPFGLNIFYLQSVVPKSISLMDIYRSVIPFVGIQVLGLAVVMIFPQIALWLPNMIMG